MMSAPSTLTGPRGQFLLGSLKAFNNDKLRFLLEQRQYGDLTRFYFGPFRVIVVNHPDWIHDVLVSNADKYYKRSINKRVLAPFIGERLVASDGAFWKPQRRLMQPAFHSKRIGTYGEIMVKYADELANGWQDGAERAIDQ